MIDNAGVSAREHAEIDVSVLIVNWNTRQLLGECLRSVFEQTREVTMEVIVVDNGSTDGSSEMVRREFPLVTLVENRTNVRFVTGNNQAIALSRGRYVLLLNSDTLVLDDAIDQIVSFADRHMDCGIVGGRVLNADMSTQSSCFMYPSLINQFLAATYLYKVFPRSRIFGRQLMSWWNHDDVRDVETISGCFALVRAAAIEAVGPMDPVYYFYGDDHDWCYRFKQAGWSVRFSPEPRVIHFGGQSTRHMKRQFLLQLHGSVLIFCRIHRSHGVFHLMRLLIAVYFGVRIVPWLVMCICSRTSRKERLGTAGTYFIGFFYSLFAWKRLVMNAAELSTRLREIRSGEDLKWMQELLVHMRSFVRSSSSSSS